MSARADKSRALPIVPPRVEHDGRVYYTEYSWSETHCGRRGPAWLNSGRPCSRKRGCGCSDHEKLARRMYASCGAIAAMRSAGLLRPDEMDEGITPREALARIRPYLPHIRTAAQLFVASAWQPFKSVYERGHVWYVNFGLVAWARARAAGKPAPWERSRPRRRRSVNARLTVVPAAA